MGIDVVHHARDKRPPKYWTLMGPMFASSKVRQELVTLHDHPATDEWWVATDSKGLVGFACLRIGKASAELCHHWTREDMREKGVAKRLAEAGVARAKELEIPKLAITVGPKRIEMFKALGFSETDTKRGQYVRMEKTL